MFSAGEAYPLVVLVIITFILAGIGYKMASVPFHMWSPDVYEGAPIPITAFLSVASKAAGFGLFIRLFYSTFQASNIVGSVDWSLMLAIVSALTMTVGNLAALPQQNVKRLLAYSSIAHGGYLLMGASFTDPRWHPCHSLLLHCLPVYELGGVLCSCADCERTWEARRLTVIEISGLARRSWRCQWRSFSSR